MCTNISEPPQPILARRKTRLKAAFYFHKYFLFSVRIAFMAHTLIKHRYVRVIIKTLDVSVFCECMRY